MVRLHSPAKTALAALLLISSLGSNAQANALEYPMLSIDPSIETKIAMVDNGLPSNPNKDYTLYLAYTTSSLAGNYETLFPVCGGRKVELLTKYFSFYEKWIKDQTQELLAAKFKEEKLEIKSIEMKINHWVANNRLVSDLKLFTTPPVNPSYAIYSDRSLFSQSETTIEVKTIDQNNVARAFNARTYGIDFWSLKFNLLPIQEVVKNKLGDVESSNYVCKMALAPSEPWNVYLYISRDNEDVAYKKLGGFTEVSAEIIVP